MHVRACVRALTRSHLPGAFVELRGEEAGRVKTSVSSLIEDQTIGDVSVDQLSLGVRELCCCLLSAAGGEDELKVKRMKLL